DRRSVGHRGFFLAEPGRLRAGRSLTRFGRRRRADRIWAAQRPAPAKRDGVESGYRVLGEEPGRQEIRRRRQRLLREPGFRVYHPGNSADLWYRGQEKLLIVTA